MSANPFFDASAKVYLEELRQFRNRSGSPHTDLSKLISKALSTLSLPNILTKFDTSIYNAFVLDALSILIWNSASVSLRMSFGEEADILLRPHIPSDTKWVVRFLGPAGNYPNIQLNSDTFAYTFYSGIPMLISLEDSETYSIMSSMTTEEICVASAITLSQNSPCHLHLTNNESFRIDSRALSGLAFEQRLQALGELTMASYARNSDTFFNVTTDIDTRLFRFDNFEIYEGAFYTLYGRIDRTDRLLLRSLFYLIKSQMLWSHSLFGEDAIANVMFSLEGHLLLLQRRFNGSDTTIDLGALKKALISLSSHGENLFDFIKEGYAKRIGIVHPNPRESATPYTELEPDDFAEYFDVCRTISNYVITGIWTEDE